MTDAIAEGLRAAWKDLRLSLKSADDRLSYAKAEADLARRKLADFESRLPAVCSAAGIEESSVKAEQLTAPETHTTSKLAPAIKKSDLRTQQDYARRALQELDGDAHVTDIAARMKRLGYRHSRSTQNPRQLEASLSALPNQVDWVVRGSRPGHLRLA